MVFGLGYSMTRLARRLRDLGWQVAGTTRDPDRLAQLRAEGFDAHAFGPDRPLDPALLAGTTHLVQSISPEESGDPAVPALAETLKALPELRWVGYLSTPAVYGDRDGAWIDETAAPAPGSPRGWKRLEAERAWFAAFQDTGVPVQVFRLAGIYGPGRSAFDQLRRGRARRIDKPGQVFNRIHVDDIGSVLLASMRRPRAGAVYNVADGHPSSPNDPIEYACQLLGIDPPPLVPFEDSGLSPLGREFYAECKRLTVDRIRDELGVTLTYPGYRDGLDAIRAQEQA
ncbi:nucleoside-diphosphate-sugar epimerase [Inquilinus ginsengisoli]|uniref:Nucleoside-diphosphate-sugar epimerase n=1 Tax=Inquilinus ginsengisoli TaxID=363840 RepID=A0ABU1JSX3_9PROT|nr:SDR family oxidoreductase [Inquilinus ginsengisoli]MDR6291383.1 nucleoside-diphosphate-sugar epimerase [Inquilinus ginsengisoli]